MKKIFLLLIVSALFSCQGFLDTVPRDASSSESFWKTEDDAIKAAVGCYNDFTSGTETLYLDCTSDISYNNFSWEGGYQMVGNGSLNATGTLDMYGYSGIRRCNTFLANVPDIPFQDQASKDNLMAQVRVIRAYKYAIMNQWYGGVPLANGLYEDAEEARLPRNTKDEVYKFVMDELDLAIPLLDKVVESGRVSKGMALALKMRTALHFNQYATALAAANDIQALGVYDLHPSYAELFTIAGQGSKEVIYATQYLEIVSAFGLVGQMYNNTDGGWSSIVPTQNLVNMYEMNSGMAIEETGSLYNPVHPYADRDPRMYATVLYPGMNWTGPGGAAKVVINTLDVNVKNKDGKEVLNDNYPSKADNASKTGLTWAKYLAPADQYKDIWDTKACPILYRYAEVLLTIAECNIEMPSGDLGLAADMLDKIRVRAGMPVVDRAKYGTRETMRELLRRERCVELAGEGLRRQDIVRWTTPDGKLLAEKVLNGTLTRQVGTVDMIQTNPELRAVINIAKTENIEERTFEPYMRYLPFTQATRDQNKKLVQNEGYY